MTNKQIKEDICPYQGECLINGCKRNNDDCFIKQLFEERYMAEKQIVKLNKTIKTKEQENEELRQYHNKCCEEDTKKLEEWLEKYNQVSRDFHNGKYCNEENCNLLKAKEQECNKLYIQLKADEEYHKEEENTLRKIIKNKEERNIELYKENNKLKQALIEIEKIAKNMNISCFYDDFDCEDCDMKNGRTYQGKMTIIQKIKEVIK